MKRCATYSDLDATFSEAFIIDHEAMQRLKIMYLVVFVCLSVCLFVLSWLNCLTFYLNFRHRGRP